MRRIKKSRSKKSCILCRKNRLVVHRFIDDNKNIFGLSWLCNKYTKNSFKKGKLSQSYFTLRPRGIVYFMEICKFL